MKLVSTWLLNKLAGKYFLYNLILLIHFCPLSISQNIEPRFEHLSVKDGLPENSVKAILQDYLGYLWFGTQNGLAKYDGYEINVYQNEEKNEKSLSSNSISTIYEDRKKDLWIGTWDTGLNRFNRTTETFDHFVYNPRDSSSICSNTVYSIYEDRKARLWIGTDKGLNLLDRKTNKFEHYCFSDRKLTKELNEILFTKIKDYPKIESILQVGNNVNIIKKFTVKKECTVLIVMVGEAGYDYGWIEDYKWKK